MSSSAPSQAAIYAPIEGDLDLVVERLRQIALTDFPWLDDLITHVTSHRGKQIRPALCLLAGRVRTNDVERLVTMAAAAELLHTATLVHDDTIDGSSTRRTRPTVNALWGDNTAILLGDYLYANSADLCTSTGDLRCVRIFARTVMALCKGELNEVFSSFDLDRAREHYFQRSGRKTASLFSMATEAGGVLGGSDTEEVRALRSYGYDLGLAFQIVDDILDFLGEPEEVGKPVGNDLLQGTITLPTILYLERHPEDAVVRAAVSGRDPESEVGAAVAAIRDSEAIAAAGAIAAEYAARARASLAPLPKTAATRSLRDLVDYVLERRS